MCQFRFFPPPLSLTLFLFFAIYTEGGLVFHFIVLRKVCRGTRQCSFNLHLDEGLSRECVLSRAFTVRRYDGVPFSLLVRVHPSLKAKSKLADDFSSEKISKFINKVYKLNSCRKREKKSTNIRSNSF